MRVTIHEPCGCYRIAKTGAGGSVLIRAGTIFFLTCMSVPGIFLCDPVKILIYLQRKSQIP
jgi:hypothetical protein